MAIGERERWNTEDLPVTTLCAVVIAPGVGDRDDGGGVGGGAVAAAGPRPETATDRSGGCGRGERSSGPQAGLWPRRKAGPRAGLWPRRKAGPLTSLWPRRKAASPPSPPPPSPLPRRPSSSRWRPAAVAANDRRRRRTRSRSRCPRTSCAPGRRGATTFIRWRIC